MKSIHRSNNDSYVIIRTWRPISVVNIYSTDNEEIVEYSDCIKAE